MKKLILFLCVFIFASASSCFAVNLAGKTGLGAKVQSSSAIPEVTFQMCLDERNGFEIEGGAGSAGWAVGASYVNHFTKIGSVCPYFSAGAGAGGPIGFAAFCLAVGIGAEAFASNNLSFFLADKISIAIAPNVVAFTATIESGFRYYFQ
jgi:hypothetical protein